MAKAAAFGLDAWRFASTGDPVERLLLSVAAQRAERVDNRRMEDQARRIIRALGEAWPKAKGKG